MVARRLSIAVLILALAVTAGACKRKKKEATPFGQDPFAATAQDATGAGPNLAPDMHGAGPAGGGDVAPPMRPTGTGTDTSALKTVYFDFDRSDIRADQRVVLDQNSDWLKANPTAKILIEGHCDERGTVEYNFSLGDRRANAVRNYLTSVRGIDGARVATLSKGEEEPAAPGSTEEAYALNRRGMFKLMQ